MTKKILVGATVPGPLGDSKIMMELELDLKDDDNIYKATNDAKMLLVVLKHFLVEKMRQSHSRQGNYVNALKMARTVGNSVFMPF